MAKIKKISFGDLANIKNAEDVKKVAKKAFIEQDKNGRKKFKPVAIVLIVIFAINIFANLIDVAFDAVDGVFEGIESAFTEELVVGDELLIHGFSLRTYVDGATFDRGNDCLTIDIAEMYFEYYGSHDEYYDSDTDEWQDDFSSPENYLSDADVDLSLVIYDEKDVQEAGFDEYSYRDSIDLPAELTETGELKIYGLKTHLRDMAGKNVYCYISDSLVEFENAETYERFECSFYFPFNYIKISANDTVSFYDIYEDYENEGKNTITEVDLSYRYAPDEDEYLVLAYDFEKEKDTFYPVIKNKYNMFAMVYELDLHSGFNKSCVGDKTNISSDLKNLVLAEPTLLKVKDGKITESYKNKEEIKKYFSKYDDMTK